MTYLQIGKIIIDLIFQYSSPHLHIILWLKDAPKFDGKNMAECINFIDRFISCNNDFKYSSLQKHKHTITCQKKKKDDCRFNIPYPILDKTLILSPLNEPISTDYRKFLKEKYLNLKEALKNIKDEIISYPDFIRTLDISESNPYLYIY